MSCGTPVKCLLELRRCGSVHTPGPCRGTTGEYGDIMPGLGMRVRFTPFENTECSQRAITRSIFCMLCTIYSSPNPASLPNVASKNVRDSITTRGYVV